MRLQGLDIFRGIALVLMISFHFSFDLNNFHILDLDLRHGTFWLYYRDVIVTMFVFTAGISLQLANKSGINVQALKKRVFLLGGASLLVSIGSYTQFEHSWIYFGILHFFLFASIAGLIFLKVPKVAFIVGVGILVGYHFDYINMHWLFHVLQKPLHLPIAYTEDLANIFPWFGVFLLGLVFASYGLHRKVFNTNFWNSQNPVNRFFSFLGKHSLLVYLLHQPILFAVFLSIPLFK